MTTEQSKKLEAREVDYLSVVACTDESKWFYHSASSKPKTPMVALESKCAHCGIVDMQNRIKELESENAKLKEELSDGDQKFLNQLVIVQNKDKEIRALREIVNEMREGLKFYGEFNHWKTITVESTKQRFCIMQGSDLEYFRYPNQDSYCGKKARETLESVDKKLGVKGE